LDWAHLCVLFEVLLDGALVFAQGFKVGLFMQSRAKPKVGELKVPVGVDKNIVWLDISIKPRVEWKRTKKRKKRKKEKKGDEAGKWKRRGRREGERERDRETEKEKIDEPMDIVELMNRVDSRDKLSHVKTSFVFGKDILFNKLGHQVSTRDKFHDEIKEILILEGKVKLSHPIIIICFDQNISLCPNMGNLVPLTSA